MAKAFNKNIVDFTKEYMFFGEQPNVIRFDVQKFPIFDKLNEKQVEVNELFDMLDESKNITDEVRQLLTFS